MSLVYFRHDLMRCFVDASMKTRSFLFQVLSFPLPIHVHIRAILHIMTITIIVIIIATMAVIYAIITSIHFRHSRKQGLAMISMDVDRRRRRTTNVKKRELKGLYSIVCVS